MGERWKPFAAYNVDRARTPSRGGLDAGTLRAFVVPAIAPEVLARIAVPTTLIWGRHDLATPLTVAEAASARYGWPLHVIEDAGDDAPIGASRRSGPRRSSEARHAGPRCLDAAAAVGPVTRASAQATLLLERDDRQDARRVVVRADGPRPTSPRAVRHARDRGLALLGARRRSQHRRHRARRRRADDRHVGAARRSTSTPRRKTATVGAGCLLGDVDHATQRHGLATPLGFFSEVGVAGLTLGGGLGYLTRRFGWTVDNLLAVEIVTADGQIRTASRDENPDLFWAVRGAGANLGAVTSFTFRAARGRPDRLRRVDRVAVRARRGDPAAPTARSRARPARELTAYLILLRAPAAPFVPEAWHGERLCAMATCFSGDLGGVDEAFAPIRAIGEPVVDLLHEQPYVELQSYLNDDRAEGRATTTGAPSYVSELSDGLLTVCREVFAECPVPGAEIGLLHIGGALNERDDDDGAVGNRDAQFVFGVIGMWAARRAAG